MGVVYEKAFGPGGNYFVGSGSGCCGVLLRQTEENVLHKKGRQLFYKR
jgi:hypothetical protein